MASLRDVPAGARAAEPQLDQSPSHVERVKGLAEYALNKDFSLSNEPVELAGAWGKSLKIPVLNAGELVASRRKKTWT